MDALLSNLPWVIAALVLLALLVAVLWYAARLAEPAPPEERPAGPPTGTVALERKVAVTLAMIIGMIVLFAAYGFKEPARQAQAAEQQQNVSIGRGIGTFTTLCYSCHGEKGQGAVVPGSEPERIAPPLDRPDFRPTDADGQKKTYDLLYKTIQRGRPGTPMPAWGQTDGGTLLPEQINELVLMIMNGDKPVYYEGKTETPWQHTSDIINQEVKEGIIPSLPKQPEIENQDWYKALTPAQQQGAKVIVQRGCGSCHTIPNIPGASGTIGPSLDPSSPAGPVSQRKTIAGGAVPNNSVDDLAKWIQNPPALKPGTAMPVLGLSPDEAHAAAEYLYSLK
jgi:mono/diheme cytochrome c family protein